MNAKHAYKHLDEIIEIMNDKYGHEFNLFYSTPSQYVDALDKANITFPTKYDDMFPYADYHKDT